MSNLKVEVSQFICVTFIVKVKILRLIPLLNAKSSYADDVPIVIFTWPRIKSHALTFLSSM